MAKYAQITATTADLKSECIFDAFHTLGIRTGSVIELNHEYDKKYLFTEFKWKGKVYSINTKLIQCLKK